MDKFKLKNRKFFWFLAGSASVIALATLFTTHSPINNSKLIAAEVKDQVNGKATLPLEFKIAIEKNFKQANSYPETFNIDKRKFKIEYAFNNQLDAQIKKLLKMYRSDYSTVTVIDNETGEVLAAVGHEGKPNRFDASLILSSTHPSASLIKIITAAELVQNAKISKDTPFEFRGRSTTLFKYQLNDSKNPRWDKSQTFETAFAKSNNVIFGKAAIQNMNSQRLVKMAENFGFNDQLMNEFDFLKSQIKQADDDYKLAELASGFNNETVVSPIHAASIASIIANDGILKNPIMISKIVDANTGEVIWQNSSIAKRVITAEANKEMMDMMEMTIDGGTARKSFKKMNTGYKNALEIGGKTGSITGGKPFGKRDWFAAYAIPKDPERGKGISISVMNVNVKRWHVKSTMLAKNIIEYYYNNIKPVPITMVKMPKTLSAQSKRYRKSPSRSTASKKSFSQKRKSSEKKQIGKRNERKSKARI
jgi:peptidoglycan glycosyltransferase